MEIVLAILRGKTYLFVRGSTRGDEKEEAGYQVPEDGGADDGFWHPDCFGV